MKDLTRLIMLISFVTLAPLLAVATATPHGEKVQINERVIILTDIEADPDDTQSLVRLLLYSNCIDIQGIVATTSCWKRTSIAPDSIRKVVRAYGEIQPNLLQHESGYPTSEFLLELIKNGPALYGMKAVGDGQESEGSNWIIQELEKDDPRPLWISVWGGVNTLAQALDKIRRTKPEMESERLISKLRVYTISDQDDSGVWIREQFPSLQYIVSPGDNYGKATWNAINNVVENGPNDTIRNSWLAENIQQNHGPLGACYPDVSWGFEGDTPAFLGIIPNGLNAPSHPEWGGWGGRYVMKIPEFTPYKGSSGVPNLPEVREIWTDSSDKYTPFIPSEYGRNVERSKHTFEGGKVSLWRWRDEFQNDFAARMDWCLNTYADANHPPVPVLSHPTELTVKSGHGFELNAMKSYDPDGDSLSYLWFHYPEAGTYPTEIKVGGANNAHAVWVTAPKIEGDQPETLHIILKLTDKGKPALSRYKRIVVTVEP